MRLNKIHKTLTICLILLSLVGCGSESRKKADIDLSGITLVCELATLRCYYNNVAKYDAEATSWFGIESKTVWLEYSGIVEYGIDVSKLRFQKADEDGTVKITMPSAEILNENDLDIETIGEPIVDKGIFTKVTLEEQTDMLAKAQENMLAATRANTGLFKQAELRAKLLIEEYVENMGKLVGKEYHVEWVEADE